MVFLQILFHKDIDSEQLKKEIGKLHDLMREYTLHYKQKIGDFAVRYRSIFDQGSYDLLKPKIRGLMEDIIRELKDVKKQERIISIILQHEVLVGKEEDIIEQVRGMIESIVRNLEDQLDIFNQLDGIIEKHGFLPPNVKYKETLDELYREEQESLFGEEKDVEELTRLVVEGEEFPIVRRVQAPAIQTAILAERNLHLFDNNKLEIGFLSSIPPEISGQRTRLVFYPASGDDPIIIFCFPNARMYILQDIENPAKSLRKFMEIFNRTNIIQNLRIKGNTYNFSFNSQPKTLITYFGKSRGDSTKYVPPEIKRFGIDILYTKKGPPSEDFRAQFFNNFKEYFKRKSYINSGLHTKQNYENVGFKEISEGWWQK